jgi:membrane protease YdiL (CAAX protease family)
MQDEKYGAEPNSPIPSGDVPAGLNESSAFTQQTTAFAEPYPFWGWLDAALFFCVLIFLLISVILVASISGFISAMGRAPGMIVAQGIGMGLSILMLSRLLRGRYGRGLRESLHLGPPQHSAHFALIGLATALAVGIFGAIMDLSELDIPMKQLVRTDRDLLVVGIGAVTFGPLFEEIIFRGFLQPLFCKVMGAAVGIIATAALFALPHGSQYGWHWQHLVVITSAGAVFGYIRWRYTSTTASTIAHAAYNAFLVAALFLQRALGEAP